MDCLFVALEKAQSDLIVAIRSNIKRLEDDRSFSGLHIRYVILDFIIIQLINSNHRSVEVVEGLGWGLGGTPASAISPSQ